MTARAFTCLGECFVRAQTGWLMLLCDFETDPLVANAALVPAKQQRNDINYLHAALDAHILKPYVLRRVDMVRIR